MTLKALLISALAVGAYAQTTPLIESNCTIGTASDAPTFSWCATVANGTQNAMLVAWRVNAGDDTRVDVFVGLNGRDMNFGGWCGWGLSDTPNMPNSSVIVFGADIVLTGTGANFDRQIGPARVAPAISATEQQLNATVNPPMAFAGFGWGTIITRPRVAAAGLPDSRTFNGSVNMIVACGDQTTFGAAHNINQAAFAIVDVDNPVPMQTTVMQTTVDPPNQTTADPPMATTAPPGGGASHLHVASAIVIAVIGSITVALF